MEGAILVDADADGARLAVAPIKEEGEARAERDEQAARVDRGGVDLDVDGLQDDAAPRRSRGRRCSRG